MVKMAPIVLIASAICLAPLFGQNFPESRLATWLVQNQKNALSPMLSAQGLAFGAPIYIRIFKQEKELEMWVQGESGFKLFKIYDICTYGPRGLGPKTREGDARAPEGFYFVKPSQLNPWSQFHLAFNIGYPNKYERQKGWTGSAIMVHGDCASIGCFAMTDDKIEQIYALAESALRNGQGFFRVHCFPFRMTDENMQRHRDSEWFNFWQNLKVGYDYFDDHNHMPPNVEVARGRYVFN